MSLLQKLVFRIAPPDTAKLKEQRNVRALIKVLQYHKSEVFRSSAAEALGELKDTEAVTPLLAALKDSSGMVQINAANALGNIGGAHAVDALCSALKDGAAIGYVARALASIGDARAVEPLCLALTSGDYLPNRIAVVEALGSLRDERALGPLRSVFEKGSGLPLDGRLVKDMDQALRKKAGEALERIQPTPGSPEAWAQHLKAKKDFSALAAVMFGRYDWPRVRLAQTILAQAGSEAVDSILKEIASHGTCSCELAKVLVDIGDPRAIEVLWPRFLEGKFKSQPFTHQDVEGFLTKFDVHFQEEMKAVRSNEEKSADVRLTAAPAEGTPLREYSTAYIFQPAASAKRAYNALQSATRSGKPFPLAAPYQVALVHGPAADFIAVLVCLPTPNDESVALNRRIEAWFAETGAGSFDDFETLNAPLPGRLSRGLEFLPDQYSVLEIIDKL